MQSTLFDYMLENRLSGPFGKMSPACSRPTTTRSGPSWQDWSEVMSPSIHQGSGDGQMRAWFLDPSAAPHGASWTPSTSAWRNDGGGSSSSLVDILEGPDDGTDLTRYYLSARAAIGILRRAEVRGKELPVQLRTALEAVAVQMDTDTATGCVETEQITSSPSASTGVACGEMMPRARR